MKKTLLLTILLYVVISCSDERHKHDGKYTGSITLIGNNVDVCYELRGEELTISNGFNSGVKYKCRQLYNSVEYQASNGNVSQLFISDNGELRVNDNIILHKINSKNESDKASYSDEKNRDGSYKYICTQNRFSNFVVLNSSSDRKSKPYLVTYSFKGAIKNNTENIYEKAFIRGELVVVLKNGEELTCDKINYSKEMIGSGVFPVSKRNWKPNEEWILLDVESCRFSVEYFDYPIKEVYTQYFLQLTDQIHNSEIELMISKRDVTDRWKIAEKKYRNNISDCTDTGISLFLKTK